MSSTTANGAPLLSVRGTLDALRLPTAQDVLLSVKGAAAVTLALLIGFDQNLENPYWSALTIYVLLAQPQTGAIRTKALFRLAGTVLGGAGAVALASLFGSDIGVLLVATIMAILFSFYAKTLDRTPASYTWFATSLTLPVIALLQIESPDSIFEFATARTIEIGLGILMIGLVDSAILPRAGTPNFVRSIREWRAQASDLAAAALVPDASQDPEAARKQRKGLHRLSGLLGPLDALGVQLPYDTVAAPPRGRDLRLVRLTIAHLIAELAACGPWIAAVRRGSGDASDVEQLSFEVRRWLLERSAFDNPAILDHVARGHGLRDRLAAFEPGAATSGDRESMVRAVALSRLTELVNHWSKLEQALHAIATGSRMPSALRAEARQARPIRGTDYVLGLLDVAPLALGLGFGALFWYATAWTSGLSAMLFVYISLGLALGTPGAQRSANGIVLWVAVAGVTTLVYQFGVFPRVTAFPVLIAVLAVGIIPLGVLMTMSTAGVLILALFFAFLGLRSEYAGDFETTVQTAFGALAGCLIGAAALYLCQFDRARFSARRLARALRRDLVDIARSRRIPGSERLLSLSIDRIALYFGAVDALPDDDALRRRDLFEVLCVACDLLRMRAHETALSPAARAPLRALRMTIAREHEDEKEPDRSSLLVVTENAYDAVLGERAGRSRMEVLAALTGLRVTLSADPAKLSGRTE
jgi:uncharacterized membrane protein YccC